MLVYDFEKGLAIRVLPQHILLQLEHATYDKNEQLILAEGLRAGGSRKRPRMIHMRPNFNGVWSSYAVHEDWNRMIRFDVLWWQEVWHKCSWLVPLM